MWYGHKRSGWRCERGDYASSSTSLSEPGDAEALSSASLLLEEAGSSGMTTRLR